MLLTVAALVHFRKNGFASENDFPPSTPRFKYEVRGEQITSLLYRNDYVLPPPPPPPPPPLLYLTTKASIDLKPTNLDPPGM